MYESEWDITQKRYLAHQKRQQRLLAAREIARHNELEWFAMRLLFVGCAACGTRDYKIEKDHVTPLCWGGSDGIDNLQPLCARCNNSKKPLDIDYRPSNWREKIDTIMAFAESL